MYAASETRFMRSPESDSQAVFAPRETHWHNTVGDSEMPVGKRFRLYRKISGLQRWQSSILIFRKTFKLNYGKISMLILNLQQPIHRPY